MARWRKKSKWKKTDGGRRYIWNNTIFNTKK